MDQVTTQGGSPARRFYTRLFTRRTLSTAVVLFALGALAVFSWRCMTSWLREKQRREDLTWWLGEDAASLVLQRPDLTSLRGRDLLGMIADKSTGYEDFLLAVESLEKSWRVREERSYWSRIANSTEYPERQRTVCAFELLKRHVHAGMTLEELATILDKPTWLGVVTDPMSLLTGLPLKWRVGDTLLIIYSTASLSSASFHAYVTVRRQWDGDALQRLLLTGEGDPSLRGARIRSFLIHPSDLADVELALMRLGDKHGYVKPGVGPADRRRLIEDLLRDRS